MAEYTGYLPEPKGFATTAIHGFQHSEQWDSMAVVAPLVTSTTTKQEGPSNFKKFVYARCGNPNRDLLQNLLATLDNAKYGLCWSSGMCAITAVTGLLKAGDHAICGENIYEGTEGLFRKVCTKSGIDVTFVDETKIASAIKPNTKLIWVESVTNPSMKVVDIKELSGIAHKNKSLLAVDNTFVSPYFLRPLDFGADIVVHSLTKYINGHSDVMMGVASTNSEEIYDQLKVLQEYTGGVPSPSDCYQVTRSLKTLALRMKQHMKNGIEVAKFLETHPRIEKVLYPGLAAHPQHQLYKKQASGCSGMISIYLKNAEIEESRKFLTSLKVITLAESLGGVESLVELPNRMSHAAVADDKKKRLKITDNLIRFSIGIEDIEDLISDLKQALDKL